VREATAADLGALVAAVAQELLGGAPVPRPGTPTLYLVAGTSHLAEGWRERVPRLELAADTATAVALEGLVRRAAVTGEVPLVWESPADVIPLPAGWEARARDPSRALAGARGDLAVRHFDPYGVVLRLVARGDEADYLAALEYVRHGWVALDRLERMLAEVLPRCTSETLAQDPAEFRRKFRGLRQVATTDAAFRGPDGNLDKLDRVSRGLHTRPSITDA
jgi:hypothetical protein